MQRSAVSKRKPSHAKSKPRRRRQQPALKATTTRIVPAAANRALTTTVPTVYVIQGAGAKHGPGRKQFGPFELAQKVLRKIPNRNELSDRQLEEVVNRLLVREPGFRSRYGKDKRIHRKTVVRARKVLMTLGY
jgi:hypothetical protein